VLCAKRKELKTGFDSRSIAPESLHETMFREHFSGELKLEFEFPSQTASKSNSTNAEREFKNIAARAGPI
jgi:hypothetical protein